MLVDQLASGVLARGHRVTLLCGGPVAERPYHVQRNGGTYSSSSARQSLTCGTSGTST